MLHDITQWLSDQLAELSPAKVLSSLTALLGAAGTAGTLVGAVPVRAAVLAAVFLVALTFIISTLTERKADHAELAASTKLLAYYCDLIERQVRLKLEMAQWVQTISINQRGDAVVTRRITVTPTGNDLHFLAPRLRYYGATPLSSRSRRRVRTVAREITEGGEGPRLVTTSSWRDDREHQILIHFDRPVPAGKQVSVEVEWRWPLFSADLMHGGVEDFDLSFHHPVASAIQRVVLLKRTGRDRFLTSPICRLGKVESSPSDSAHQVSFAIDHPNLDQAYGVRIDKAQ